MIKFYKGKIDKISTSSATQYKEPELNGNIIVTVTDSTTSGNFKIYVVDTDENQHKSNLEYPGVEELSEKQAIKLAAKYQPQRVRTDFNPLTLKEEKRTIAACDLTKYYKKE